MHRRDLLKLAAATAPLIACRAFAAPETKARLLVVFLRGAYDATNFLVPVSSGLYYQSRPNIAIARPNTSDPTSAISLNQDWGLHPSLRESIYPLWQKGQVAFAPYAGADDMSRSHFETQDTIEMGQPIQGGRNARSGFMGRLTASISGADPIAFTSQVPIIFQGIRPIPNIALNGGGKGVVDDRQQKLISGMYHDDPLGPNVSVGFDVGNAVNQTLATEMVAASRGAASARGFEGSARRVARLMRDEFNIAFLDVGGWDTHVNQGGANGYLATRLSELGRGLAGYADEIGPGAWNDTVVVVVSEFGRTMRENGDKGTDHGHGSVYWIMGGGVRGGRILGDHGPMTASDLNQNRDYPVKIDYREMFGGLFQRMYGLDTTRLQSIFPATKPRELDLI